MTRAIRSALMYLILVALPFQGFAAAMMLACGPGHHQAAVIKGAADGDALAFASEHHHDGGSPARHLAYAGTPSADHGHHHGGKLGKCSVCAACCSVAALPTAPVSFDTVAPDSAVSPSAAESGGDFFTDGPQRPPRTILV